MLLYHVHQGFSMIFLPLTQHHVCFCLGLTSLSSSVIRTSNRDGGEPFKALVPDCSVPETLGAVMFRGLFSTGKCTRNGG